MANEEIEIPDAHKDVLARNVFGVVTTLRAKDGLLSSNPVSYVFDGDCVRISTLKNRVKFRNLEGDDRVTFCVMDAKDPTVYVELRGRASLEDDPDRAFLRRQFRAGSGGQEPPEDLDPAGSERAIIRIHPVQSSSPSLYGGRFAR
ncbi:MAG: pyridoxamine 5'-phosphate oxidase family protein [Myxococcota bacterium]